MPERRESAVTAVERACAELVAERTPVSYRKVAERSGVASATLFRHPELKAVVERHQYSDPADVVDLLVRFDESMPEAAAITREGRQSAVLRFSRWLRPRSILDATPADVEAWLQEVAPARRGRTAGHLHRFYTWLLNRGLVDVDPTVLLVHVRQPLEVGQLPGVLADWQAAMERKGLSPMTIKARVCRLRFFADYLTPRSVFDATTKDVESFLGVGPLRSSPLGTDALRGYLSSLHQFYRWAARQGLTESDPTEAIDRPRRPERVPRPIKDTELAAALHEASPVVRAVLCLAAYCGLRAKEIAGVHREDILDHLEAPALIVSSPKGRRQRTVPLHAEAWKALQAMGFPRSGPVFVRPDGRQMPPYEVSHVGCNYLASIGSASTLHALRHWYGTQVYRASKDIRLTQELMGHTSMTQTALYVQADQSAAHSVIDRLPLLT